MTRSSIGSIIFDLDDTLMDTWGQLVRPAAREACAAMIAAGLNTDLETCLRERERLFCEHPRDDVYALLVNRFGCRPGIPVSAQWMRETGYRAYFHRHVSPDIHLFDGVAAMLERLKAVFVLYLVTSGSPVTQKQKVNLLKCGSFFHEIAFLDSARGETKDQAFARILASGGKVPTRWLCVGDRVDREIRAGRRLGMRTCRVHCGEFHHLNPSGPEETPDFVIQHILELERILEGETRQNKPAQPGASPQPSLLPK